LENPQVEVKRSC